MSMSDQSSVRSSSRTAVDTLVWLIDDAFRGDPQHALLANLHSMPDQAWSAVPPGGGRSIADILEHVAWSKWMYADYAFGSAALRGDVPPLVPPAGARARPGDELLAWLSEGHDRWLTAVRA